MKSKLTIIYIIIQNRSKVLQICSKMLQNCSKMLQMTPFRPCQSGQGAPFCSIFENLVLQNAPNCSKMLHFQDNKPTCEYCLRTYSKNSNLTKHLKVCKKKKQQELLQNTELAQIKKELEELKSYNKIQHRIIIHIILLIILIILLITIIIIQIIQLTLIIIFKLI